MAVEPSDPARERSGPAGRSPVTAPLGTVTRPFRRTGRYYARMWRDYLDERHEEDLPVARPTLALATQAFRDEVVLLGLRGRRPIGGMDVFERINAEVSEAIDFYGSRGFLDEPEKFFAAPPPLTEVTLLPREGRRRSHDRIRWESGYAPLPGSPARSGGAVTPATTAPTRFCCDITSPDRGWWVCTAPRWAVPGWTCGCFGRATCMRNSA